MAQFSMKQAARPSTGRRERGGEVLRAAIVVHPDVAGVEGGPKKDVGPLRAIQGAPERGAILDVGDGDLSPFSPPCLPPVGLAMQHDANGFPLREQRACDDLARVPRSTQDDEH
jgi:hypothetical protein